MYYIIYGPEGSGKGTQAKLLSDNLKIPVITSGDLVREKAKEESDLGKICLSALKQGCYVADDIMFKLWEEKLSKSRISRGFIVDGFPRTILQAKFLLTTLEKFNLSVDKFIYLKLTDSEARIRLLKRKRKLFKGSKISHDTTGRINKRLEVYRAMESKIIDFFKKKNLLIEIDAQNPIEVVFRSIIEKIDKSRQLPVK